MTSNPELVNSSKVNSLRESLRSWVAQNVDVNSSSEMLHAAIAMDGIERKLRFHASKLASLPEPIKQEDLLQQCLRRKIALARTLRLLMGENLHWVGGNVLSALADTIACVEEEVEEMSQQIDLPLPDPQRLEQLEQVFDSAVCCPMGHSCKSTPCPHVQLCTEVKNESDRR